MISVYKVSPPIANLKVVAAPQSWTALSVNRWFSSIGSALIWFSERGYSWDFESTWVTRTAAQRDALIAMGFPSVLAAADFTVGEKYVFKNGSFIEVNSYSGSSGVNVWYGWDNTRKLNDVLPGSSDWAAKTLLPSTVLSDMNTCQALGMDMIDTTPGNLRFHISGSAPWNNFPEFLEFYNNASPITDPYTLEQGGDESEPGGGDGEEDEEDDIDFTEPPSSSIGATGFLTIFCPSLTELRSLATFMWGSFDVDNWRKLFANPMDAILGLHIIPVPAVITGTKAVKVAGIDTTLDMSYTTIRYIRRPMGTCNIPKKWGAYLDYSPYTKISIFLPYIGFKELDADDVMGKTIALQYMIDILTGACVAELKCGDTVLYSWQGNCANEVPISGSDWRGAITSALGIAATVATTVATGGASAPMIAGTIASVGANSLNLKPTINRSGSISGSAGFAGRQRPYIIRSIPNLVIPADQNKFIGYPAFVNASLGSLSGYNEIASIHLDGIPATGNELAEIETLLKGGVIF